MQQENQLKVVNKKGCHAELVSASSTHVVSQRQQRRAWKTLKQVQGDNSLFNNSNNGFTLIELLVVVLIIGILAAVALPQYQKAVEKARLATLIPLVRSLANAKSAHYLATGEWARTFDVLSVEIPAEFTISDNDHHGQRASCQEKKMLVAVDEPDVYNSVYSQLTLADGSRVLYLVVPITNRTYCWGAQGKRSEALCKNLPTASFSHTVDSGGKTYAVYNIN